jgi:hypothetical protein
MTDAIPEYDAERRSADLLANALHYAGMGYSVFPTMPDGADAKRNKAPLTDRGYMDATTNELIIRHWWEKWPLANVAIVTAGLVVIDTDPGNTWLAHEDFADFVDDLNKAPQAITPRGGSHRFFRQPDGCDYHNTASKIAPHVDTRANGGYVIAAPSRIDGKEYRWLEGAELPRANELPLPPDWLLRELDRTSATNTAIDADCVSPAESVIPEGQRNDTLFKLGCSLRRIGLSRPEIDSALQRINMERCVPRLQNEEVSRLAASASRYEPNQIAVAVAEGHYDLDRDISDEPPAPAEPEIIASLSPELLAVGGLMGRICDFTNATAFRKQPDLALAGAIALMSVLTGRKVRDNIGTRTNLYLFGLAPSGGGKDRARQVNKEIMTAADGLHLIGQESFASAQGLFSQVETRKCVLCQVDELGEFLRAIRNPKASHLHGVTAELLKLYSSAGSVYLGAAYADAKRNTKINQPHFVFYGTTVSESFFDSMTEDSITGGLLARSIFFEGTNELQPKQDALQFDVPAEIVQEVKAWLAFNPAGNMQDENPKPMTVPLCAEAAAVFAEAETYADEQHNRLRYPLGTIYTRLVEQARKLALLHACSQLGPTVSEIGKEAATWAVELMRHRCERMRYLAERRVSNTEYGTMRLKLMSRIEDAGKQGVDAKRFNSLTKHIEPTRRKLLVADLIEHGDIIVSGGFYPNGSGYKPGDKGGRPKKFYVASKFGALITAG